VNWCSFSRGLGLRAIKELFSVINENSRYIHLLSVEQQLSQLNVWGVAHQSRVVARINLNCPFGA
jgi:hypothetical protein